MNIETLHSALISLIVLPEALHWARENLKASDPASQGTLEEFLKTAARDLCTAKATLARELGFSPDGWPSESLARADDGESNRPAATETNPLPSASRSDAETRPVKTNPQSASFPRQSPMPRESRLDSFMRSQRECLLQLRDAVIDSITDVAKDNLRESAGSGADCFREDAGDAGSDAFDRDLALSLLAQERDALSEIDDALRRIEAGSYGVCEICGNPIPHARLEAIPFARLTVECQAGVEKRRKVNRARRSMRPAFEFERESVGAQAGEAARLLGRYSSTSR